MKQYRLIIFDLDGTLLDSIQGIAAAMNAVLKNHSLPCHKLDAYYYFVGNGLRKLAERALPQEELPKLEQYYSELLVAYADHYEVGMKLYPGIAEALDFLQQRGYQMAINSNKVDSMVEKITNCYFAKWNWISVTGARTGVPIKPDSAGAMEAIREAGVTPDEVLYVGDSEVDLQTAVNAGVDSAFVTWGFRRLEDIAGLPVTYVIHSAEELRQLLS